jgi:SAM-dependent methyltransferase
VHAIDISPESAATTRKVLTDAGYGDVCRTYVMDGENLQFHNSMFDIIICSGVLHHVDVDAVFPELARVLKPGGTLIGLEALGYNPVISMYRRLTPRLRTAWEPDHILTIKDLKIADRYFAERRVHYFYLFSILAVPFRRSGLFKPLLATLRAIDSVVLKIPGLQLLAWQMVFFLGSPRTRASSDVAFGTNSGS